jgi:glutathione S-transferase
MRLYFSPLACSLASRIALYEANANAEFTQVDIRTKLVHDGSDFLNINPMGQVPVLQVNDNILLTENTAILQFIAEQFPEAHLAPTASLPLAVLRQWLSFIGTELHKAIFIPLLDPDSPPDVKTYSQEKVALRFKVLETHLSNNEFVLESFSIADAYLTTVLNWAPYVGIDLAQWPAVQAYHARMKQRPSVARAMKEEWELYQKETQHAKQTLTTSEVIQRFNNAFKMHDGESLRSLIAQDCVLENSSPAPDGATYSGHVAVFEFWSALADDPNNEFEPESVFIAGEQAVVCWRFRWGPGNDETVRGVNLTKVVKGAIVGSKGYIKA